MKLQTKKQSGITLIELMIVVVIVSILAVIAYPAYTEQVRKSRRGDAAGALMGLAAAMERHYTETGGYTGAAAGGGDTGAPDIYPTTSPIDGSSQPYYNLVITAATGQTYTITADPITGSDQEDDRCDTLSLNNQGAKGASGDTVEQCW
jgi:type IV pilus assembly protein PilE